MGCPSTTEHPEDVVKLADFLASREGKLLGQYGIKGRDYTLDKRQPTRQTRSIKEVKTTRQSENVVSEARVHTGLIILVIQI